MNLAEQRWLRLFTLCLLYVAQGIPWGFTATTIPAYLTSLGVSEALVTSTLAFTVLPYTFKWLFGPLIDAFTIPSLGRRRPWIVFAQGMMAVTILAMVAVPDLRSDVKLLAWMILIHTVFNALQDVAVDALGVDLLGDDERGRANAFMYASKIGGGVVGGVGMAKVIKWYGFDTALIVQVAILLGIMMVPLLVRERPAGPPPERPQVGEVARSLARAFSLRSTLVGALFALVIQLPYGITSGMGYGLFVGELGWEYDEYLELSAGWILVVGCAGAMLGGLVADRVGRRRTAAVASIALALGWIGFALLRDHWTDATFIYVSSAYQAWWLYIMVGVLFAVFMDISWSKVGGSQFTAYMSLLNVGTTLGYQLVPSLTSRLDYGNIYLAMAAAQIAITPMLLAIDLRQTRKDFDGLDGRPIRIGSVVAIGTLVAVLLGFTVYVTWQRLG
ncbi:MAG: MFS transporter [Deltaproteobacteria bacterium]|nr:MFS transporter [Deltaproteobacteria bacterium]